MKPPREMFVTGFALWLCLDLDLCNISQDTATCLSGITATVYSMFRNKNLPKHTSVGY